MTLRHFEEGDLAPCIFPSPQMELETYRLALLPNGYVRTVELYDTVLAVFGLVVRWEGVGESWAVMTEDAPGHGLAITKAAKLFIRGAHEVLGIRRIGCIVRYDELEHRKWVTLLGYEPEFFLRSYAEDGGDVMGYVKWA